jgi:WD40 repeat protein
VVRSLQCLNQTDKGTVVSVVSVNIIFCLTGDKFAFLIIFCLCSFLIDSTVGVPKLYLLYYSPDASEMYFAAANLNTQSVDLYDPNDFQKLCSLTGHKNAVTCLAFANSVRRLASAECDDETDGEIIKVWDLNSMSVIVTLHTTLELSFMSFSANGEELLTTSSDGFGLFDEGNMLITKWDLQTLAAVVRIDTSDFTAKEAFFISADSQIVAVSREAVIVWDSATGAELRVIECKGGGTIASISVSPDEVLLAAAMMDGVVIVDMKNGQQISTLRGLLQAGYCVCFCGDGSRVASSSQDGAVVVWDIATEAVVTMVQLKGRPARSLSLNADGTKIACHILAVKSDKLCVYDSQTGTIVFSICTTCARGLFSRPGVVLL